VKVFSAGVQDAYRKLARKGINEQREDFTSGATSSNE
jgi:hypothetical protein